MKKKLLTLALVTGFSVVALSSCGNEWLKKSDEAVLTIDGQAYTTEELFSQFGSSNATGVAAYYEAISEVLVRNATASYAESVELKNKVETQIETQKEKARNNADANGTSYKTEFKAILESEGVEDEDELKDKYTYQNLQEHLQDEYYDVNTDNLLKDYLDEMLPYHVRHILVNVSAAAGTLYNGTITENEAMNLASVVRRIANLTKSGAEKVTKETFGEVAFDASEDTGSAALYGNLDVMTAKTSFVNEFKLGIYAYEALVARENAEGRGALLTSNATDSSLGVNLLTNTYAIPTDAQTAWKARTETINTGSSTFTRRANGIGYIPFNITQLLEDYADITVDPKTHKKVNDGDSDYYPRNILFNHFFNDHGVNVITNDTAVGNFVTVPGFDKPILCADGNPEKPVLVTRAGSSYQGVHFIVVEKSAIGSTQAELETYYDKRTPAQLTKDGDAALIGQTYVTAIKSSDTKTYTDRSEALEGEVKDFDSLIDTRLFEYYLGLSGETPVDSDGNELPIIKINDPELEAELLNYITVSRAQDKSGSITGNSDSWDAYIDLLETQDWISTRRVPYVCAERFVNGQIVEGDATCYVKK